MTRFINKKQKNIPGTLFLIITYALVNLFFFPVLKSYSKATTHVIFNIRLC